LSERVDSEIEKYGYIKEEGTGACCVVMGVEKAVAKMALKCSQWDANFKVFTLIRCAIVSKTVVGVGRRTCRVHDKERADIIADERDAESQTDAVCGQRQDW
jgi:hypothetical protein